MIPVSEEAYKLLHTGNIVLARLEANGIRVNTQLLHDTVKRYKRKIESRTRSIFTSKAGRIWKRLYGDKLSLLSNPQLVCVLERLGVKPEKKTKAGKFSTDFESLSSLQEPIAKHVLAIRKYNSLIAKMRGIDREVVGGFLHPSYNLHLVQTYRSSSDTPNFQNIPIRDPVLGPAFRSLFFPRKGRRLVEVDYSGIEVRIAACYHLDRNMLAYIKDPTKDMHRDTAMDCFIIEDPKLVSKETRYAAKNRFVFPQFYGDYYINCAKNLWEASETMRLKVGNVDMKEHLKSKGILKLGDCNPAIHPRFGTFESHIKTVERIFWEVRFKQYAQWKRDWLERYYRDGYLRMHTGFVCKGYLKKNEIINYPIQGTAFHCLLYSLIELYYEMRSRKMKSVLVGQIHDSILADVVDSELDDFLHLAKNIMVKRLRKHWDWVVVPMDVEFEATEVDSSWYTKKEIKLA